MKLTFETFNGIAPLVNPRRLAEGLAQQAHNCVFETQGLRPIKRPLDLEINMQASTKTVYPYLGTVLEFAEEVDIVTSVINNDEHERIFYTDSTYPKVRSGASEFRLGIPRPSVPPVAEAQELATDETELLEQERVYYVFAYVDSFGAEGPISLASNSQLRVMNTDVDLTFPSIPSGDYNFGAGALIRVYRSNTGTSDTDFQFAFDAPIASASITDTIQNDELQEIAQTLSHIGPPDDDIALWPDGPLQGLVNMGGGVLAGFTDKTIHFCERNLPHAWPIDYRIPSRHKVIGLLPITSGLLVVTAGKPFLIQGSDPASLTIQEIRGESTMPCVTKRSLVDMGGYAMYATDRGLAVIDGFTGTLATEQLFSKESWQLLAPETLRSGEHQGRYIGFFELDGVKQSFVFDPLGGRNALTTCDAYAEVLYISETTGDLYVIIDDKAHLWDGGTPYTYTWRGKQHVFPSKTTFAFFELLGSTPEVEVTVFHDTGDFTFTASERYTVLPGVMPSQEISVRFRGTNELVFGQLLEDLEAS